MDTPVSRTNAALHPRLPNGLREGGKGVGELILSSEGPIDGHTRWGTANAEIKSPPPQRIQGYQNVSY